MTVDFSKYLKGMTSWWVGRSRLMKFSMVSSGAYLGVLGAGRIMRGLSPGSNEEPPHQYENMYSSMRRGSTTDFSSPIDHQSAIDRGNTYMRSRPTHSMPPTAGRVQYMYANRIGHTYHGAGRNRRYMRELFNI